MKNKDDLPFGCGCLAAIVFLVAVVWAVWYADGPVELACAVFVALIAMGVFADKPKIY